MMDTVGNLMESQYLYKQGAEDVLEQKAPVSMPAVQNLS